MPSTITGYVYDERMKKHENADNPRHPENPQRIEEAFNVLQNSGLLEKCVRIKSRCATEDELLTIHTPDHIKTVQSYSSQQKDDVCKIEERWKTYSSDSTYESATCAVGCVLQMVDAICTNQIDNGIAIVRPPGHHAEVEETCGFCYFNNLAIAAKHAQQKHNVNKILILDWDIHHGNGIQNIFYEDPNVLYMSLHRYDNGDYFPQQKDGHYDFVGKDAGEGFNVNIPFNRDKMGNSDYKYAFDKIVIPVAKQFNPDLILVACGFDAAAADNIGEYILTPEMYGYMTRCLKTVSKNGKLLLSLEGGYNVKAISQSMRCCLDVLLHQDLVPDVCFQGMICKRAQQTVEAVVARQQKYWDLSLVSENNC